MAQVKICPSCGLENPLNETMCLRCMADISFVGPVQQDGASVSDDFTAEFNDIFAGSYADDDNGFAADSGGASATVLDYSASATVVDYAAKILVLECADVSGRLTVKDGSVLGRDAEGRELLGNFQTVSRRHSRFSLSGSTWTVEDMNSTNGTWVNGRRLAPGEKCSLKSGATVALSRSCTFTVQ